MWVLLVAEIPAEVPAPERQGQGCLPGLRLNIRFAAVVSQPSIGAAPGHRLTSRLQLQLLPCRCRRGTKGRECRSACAATLWPTPLIDTRCRWVLAQPVVGAGTVSGGASFACILAPETN